MDEIVREAKAKDAAMHMINMHNERVTVGNAMIEHGGSFVRALGTALLSADDVNMQKVKDAWPDYWSTYLQRAKQQKREE